jgi:hypothetical protein
MTALKLPPFRIIHADYVTSDLEAGKRRLEAMYGVSAFTGYDGIAIEVPGGQAIIDFVVADAGGWALEAICPAGGKDHVYRQLLPDDPDDIAFHHFATRIESRTEWDMVEEAARDHGIDVPVLGHAEEGPNYIYLDVRRQLGHMLEFIWER